MKRLLWVFLIFLFIISFPLSTATAAGVDPYPQTKSLPQSKMVCLTFDDGYNKQSIITILNVLRANNVHCTFFIIGSNLKKYPSLWRQAVKDGHEIAYHTMYHKDANYRTNKQIVTDIKQWNAIAHQILGSDYVIPKIARLPFGHANLRVRKLFKSLGYTLIHWSSDTLTGIRNPHTAKRIANFLIKNTKLGSISLQHFNGMDAPSVGLYIKNLKSRFTLGKVSDALAIAHPTPTLTPSPATSTPTPTTTP